VTISTATSQLFIGGDNRLCASSYLVAASVALWLPMDSSAIARAVSCQLCPRCFTLFLAPKNEEHLKVRLLTTMIYDCQSHSDLPT
jgi:hypothetical protein